MEKKEKKEKKNVAQQEDGNGKMKEQKELEKKLDIN
jgi:hypothetical protein